MAITVGQTLGAYEIVALLGRGGMGEVYKGRDTRLNRFVAIKVLSERVANDIELKHRFEREAQTLASLSHPHICPVFDVGQLDGVDYIVMEFLEGQTLAERLEKGALPLDQVLKIAIEIADALDKAHHQGIVHRDLKPGNVMLMKHGAKLLDFGLAKLKSSDQPTTLSALPTRADLTAQGAFIGTLQYMAPEQLEGKDADLRTDVFAFGNLLYEMATGKKTFEGKSQASLIGAIMTAEPHPLSQVQPLTPAPLEHVVRRCLAKNPEGRWQSAADLCAELRWVASGESASKIREARGRPISIREIAAWSMVIVVLIAAVALWRNVPTRALPESVVRFSISPPSKGEFGTDDAPGTLSPDGTHIVFLTPGPPGEYHLWSRAIDSVDSKMLGESVAGYDVFWSPDSRKIAFGKESELDKIDIVTGAVDKICDLPDGRGGTWSTDGIIVVRSDANGPLFRVQASGGPPTPLTKLEASRQETGHWRPQFLPDGKRFIYLAVSSRPENTGIYVGSLDSPEVKRVADVDVAAYYAPPGYLLYVRQGNLMAQPFDAEKLRATQDPIVVARDVVYGGPWGVPAFSTSDTGTLAYQANLHATRLLFWFDRNGKQIGFLGEHHSYAGGARISPDGQRSDGTATLTRRAYGSPIWFAVLRPALLKMLPPPKQARFGRRTAAVLRLLRHTAVQPICTHGRYQVRAKTNSC